MHSRIAAILAALLLPFAALAQQTQPEARPGARPDPERMRQMFEQRFRKADRDGDGALTRAEAAEGMPMLARDFDRIDANADGRITPDELRAAMEKRRAQMRDHAMGDGPHEHGAGPGGPRGPGGSEGSGGPGRPGAGGHPTPEQMKARADEMWKRADANGDGALTPDEAKQASPRLAQDFAAIDANGDGRITRDEMDQFAQARRAQFEARRQQGDEKAPPAGK
jgi:Ca2+-binding EF-hand superfamily protein